MFQLSHVVLSRPAFLGQLLKVGQDADSFLDSHLDYAEVFLGKQLLDGLVTFAFDVSR